MRVVHKFRLPYTPMARVEIAMPADAEILSLVEQQLDIALYVLADYDSVTTTVRTFHVVETGLPIESSTRNGVSEWPKFIGTVVMDKGPSLPLGKGLNVLHVFEVE